MSSGTSGYRSLLRIPGAAAFFFAAAVGRVGIAMTGLGLVWLVHARTGSYGTAGLATAGFALAEALIGPQLARLVDRFGQSRVLPFCLLAHASAIVGVLAATSPAALIVSATCAGAAIPQLGAYSAARWVYLLRKERGGELPTAFSLESLANATAFLLGPVLVTALGAVGEAAPASAIAATLILTGGGTLTLQRRTAPRPARGHTELGDTQRTLLRPGFFQLAMLNLAIGLYFGTMNVSVSAFAIGHGVPGVAAPITAAASLSGLLAGWLYGLRRHRAPAQLQLVIATAYLTGTGLLLPLAPSALWLGAAMVLTEVAVPPTLVLLSVLTEKAVHPTLLTQAMTWNNSASAAGSALAATVAGRIADHLGASAAFALAPTAGLILLVLSITARQRFAQVHTNRLGRYRWIVADDETDRLLTRFAADAGRVLPMVALWAHGSLASDDFVPGRSDLDLVTLREGRLITKKEALDVLASAGAPLSVVGDIRERRYGTPPPISDEWRTERGGLASTYVRQAIQRELGP